MDVLFSCCLTLHVGIIVKVIPLLQMCCKLCYLLSCEFWETLTYLLTYIDHLTIRCLDFKMGLYDGKKVIPLFLVRSRA